MKALCIILLFTLISCSSTPTEKEEEPIIPVVIPLIEYNPSWSPDGAKVAYVGASIEGYLYRQDKPSGLYIYDTVSETDSLIVGNIDLDYPQWSPDGNELVFECNRNEICTYNLVSDSLSVVLSSDNPQYNGASGYPRFLSNHTLLLSVRLTNDEQLDLYTLDINSGELERIFDSVPGVTDGVKVEGGYAYVSVSDINFYELNTGKESTLVSGLSLDNLEALNEGKALLYDDGNTVFIRDINSGTEIPIIKDGSRGADLNKDGEMVYSRWARDDGRLYIYDLNLNQRQLLIQD